MRLVGAILLLLSSLVAGTARGGARFDVLDPTEGRNGSWAMAASRDGRVAVGTVFETDSAGWLHLDEVAVRWEHGAAESLGGRGRVWTHRQRSWGAASFPALVPPGTINLPILTLWDVSPDGAWIAASQAYGTHVPLLLHGDILTPLPLLPGDRASARPWGISADGSVLVGAFESTTQSRTAVAWRDGRIGPLWPPRPGDPRSTAYVSDDGMVDERDPECARAWQDDEEVATACGLGAELAPLVLPLRLVRRRRCVR